jgi:1,4-alpha-glucan branching enzyme
MFNATNASAFSSCYSAQRNLHHADFFCQAPQARQVFLVGDFNDWNPTATPMLRQPDGRWMANLELSHGYHQYVFLVDGKRVLDQNATGKTRDAHNEPVSLLAVS